MPTYEFIPASLAPQAKKNGLQSVADQIVELFLPISKAPDIGKTRRIAGKLMMRVLSTGGRLGIIPSIKEYITSVIPRGMEGFDHDPKTNKCVVKNRSQERFWAKVSGCEWE